MTGTPGENQENRTPLTALNGTVFSEKEAIPKG